MSAAVDALALWLADVHLLSAVLLAVVLAALALLRQPAQRMAIEKSTLGALAALTALCALPGWSLVHLLAPAPPAQVTAAALEPAASNAEPFTPPVVVYDPRLDALFAPVVPPAAEAARAAAPPAAQTASTPPTEISWPTLLVMTQLAGSAAVVAWLAIGAVVARRVRRDTRPAPPELAGKLQSIAETRAPQQPALLVSDRVATPLALGLRAPAIVLPARLIEPAAAGNDATGDVAAILVHEWAHIAAGDLRTLAVSRLLLVMLWPQPLFWLLRRRLRLDQETLADAAAAEVAGRFDYAQQLLAWSRTAAPRAPRLAGSVGLWESPSQLKRRIAALLDEKLTVLRQASRSWRTGTACAALAAAALLSLVTVQRQESAAQAAQSSDAVASAGDDSAPANEITPPALAQSNDAVAPRDAGGGSEQNVEPEIQTLPITVTGRVSDPDGAPVVDARVYLAAVRGDWKRLAEMTTDAEGRYEFRDVALPIEPARTNRGRSAGAFEVFALAAGHGFAWRPLKWVYPDMPHYDETTFPGKTDRPHAFGRDDAIELDLEFTEPATFAGRLVDDAGQPIAGATLAIRSMSRLPEGGYYSDDEFNIGTTGYDCESLNERALVPPEFKTQTTDADGRFEFTRLPENVRFRMDIRAEGFPGRSEWGTTRDGIIKYDGDRTVHFREMSLVLRRPKTVPIRVVYGDTGEPAAKVFVNVANKEAETWKSSDADGRVELPLPTGDYQVTLSPRYQTPYLRTEAKLTVAEAAPAEPHTIRLRRAAILKATVLDAETNQPLAGVDLWKTRIVPRPANGRALRETHGYRSWEEETSISHYERPRTDAEGRLTAFFEPGLYVIGIANESFPPGYASVETEGKEVTCEGGKTVEVVFYMRSSAPTNRVGVWRLVPTGGASPIDATRSAPPFGEPGLLSQLEGAVTAPPLRPAHEQDGVLTTGLSYGEEDAPDPSAGRWNAYSASTLVNTTQTDADDSDVDAVQTQSAAAGAATPGAGTTHSATENIAQLVQADADGIVTFPVPGKAADATPNTIAVRCLDDAGAPAADVTVSLYRIQHRNGTHEFVRDVRTNAAGEAVFDNLLSADEVASYQQRGKQRQFEDDYAKGFMLVARKPGLATTMFGTLELEAAVRGFRADVKLPKAQRLAGRVTAPDGSPVANALVAAGSYAGMTVVIEGVNAVRTDAEGRYEFTDRQPLGGEAARKQRTQLNFYAVGDDGPPAPAERPAVGQDWVAARLIVSHLDFAVTRVDAGDIPGTADITMLPSAAIVGRVVEHGTGAPVADMLVRAYALPDLKLDADGRTIRAINTLTAVSQGSHVAATRTDATGEYRLSNLPAGVYDVWAAPERAADAAATEQFNQGISSLIVAAGVEPVAATDLVVGPGALVRVQLVDAATGEPVKLAGGGRVLVAPQKVGGPRMQDEVQPRVDVTPDGKFEVRLMPSTFRLAMFVYEGQPGEPAYRTSDEIHYVGATMTAEHGDVLDAEVKVWPMADVDELRTAFRAAYAAMGSPSRDRAKMEQAVTAFAQLLDRYPDNPDALSARGTTNEFLGRYAAAVADYERILAVYPGETGALMRLANLLATCPESEFRDGPRAVTLATQLVNTVRERGQLQDKSQFLTILAAAQAEAGDFDSAVATQKEAVAAADDERRAELEERLKLFEAGKPYHREAPKLQ